MRRPRTLGILLIAAVLGAFAISGPGWAADVHGDDEADRYVGTGGLLLPASVDSGTRTEAAGCTDCAWRLSTPCARPTGNLFSGPAPCLSVVRGCPGGAELLRAWLRLASGPWREVGLICIGTGGPVSMAALGGAVRDRLERDLPALRPVSMPRRGVLVQLPVVFGSGQKASGVHLDDELLGQRVRLDAVPAWSWQFGDGGRLLTGLPGGPYPDLSVSHPYSRSGTYRVVVRTTWQAVYSVDGLGPFEVPGEVSQTATLPVAVGEGRAVLAVR